MGLFSAFSQSFKKSKKLRQLQLTIAPPDDDLLSPGGFERMLKAGKKKNEAIEEFLDLCQSDEGVAKVMEEYKIARSDLKEIYRSLEINGLGQWVKGHYAPLSTIAYFEPLLFYAEATRHQKSLREISFVLLEYWKGKIPQGGLIKMMQ